MQESEIQHSLITVKGCEYKYSNKHTPTMVDAIVDIVVNSKDKAFICVLTSKRIVPVFYKDGNVIDRDKYRCIFKPKTMELGTALSFSNLIIDGEIEEDILAFWLTRLRLESSCQVYFVEE